MQPSGLLTGCRPVRNRCLRAPAPRVCAVGAPCYGLNANVEVNEQCCSSFCPFFFLISDTAQVAIWIGRNKRHFCMSAMHFLQLAMVLASKKTPAGGGPAGALLKSAVREVDRHSLLRCQSGRRVTGGAKPVCIIRGQTGARCRRCRRARYQDRPVRGSTVGSVHYRSGELCAIR